ncbi:Lar family restriction alleviation protein [Citrobacter amalonaticus]|uniref:Lar family restriction alleviation protein n=1 Tax=Citrobacter amalonaticus TaxID=35703 RepID=UPI0021BBFD3C|nr:Lar family restriction alleviation protein [Citrobacter amalonaticus]
MTTITKERVAEIIHAAGLEPCYYEEVFGSIKTGEIVAMARIALASLEAEPVAYLNATDIKNSEDHILAKRLRSHACTMPVYTATPAPVVPDANGCLPCPFCNSPVKWCGENSADPDDDHICHHIQCTNPECGADFDFINTGDDLLPDDPAVLDAMTSAELVQPLREVCKGRFNLRAALLQGSQPVSNRDELLPSKSPVIPDCWCRTCRPVTMGDMRFVVCPECGNKRCPHANDHRHACTGSNEPGQEGSAYPAAPQQEAE